MKRLRQPLLMLGLALLIFGAKLWLIDTAGSDLPVVDQWDGEGEKVIRPWLEGRLTAADIFASHNEHRIITTKLYVLGLFKIGGQWNAFVETTLNAAIHTLCGLVLVFLTRRWMEERWRLLPGFVVLLLFALPAAWENTLYGFQVQFYFLLLFSLGQVALTLGSERITWRWGAGQLCGVLAVATMATGFLASVAVLIGLALRCVSERRISRQQVITASCAAILAVIGFAMKAHVPEHAFLRAATIGQFAVSFLRLLAWPGPYYLPLVFAPSALFLVRVLRRRAARPADAVLLALLTWSILQCAALAYGRGGGSVVSSRYFDLLSINVVLGGVFVVTELAGSVRRWAALVWVGMVATGLIQESIGQWRGAVEAHVAQRFEQQDHVRAFLRTQDPHEIDRFEWPQIPYPSSQVLLQRLSTMPMQNSMPPSVRRPLRLASTAPSASIPTVPEPLRSEIHAPVFSSWSPAHGSPTVWRSAPQPATTLPILRFRVAGNLGGSSRGLKLVVKSNSGEVAVKPEGEPGSRWKTVNVFRPSGEWWVEATDNDHAAWFAFTDPIEVSRWSWFAEKLLKNHRSLMLAGGLMLLFGLVAVNGRSLRDGLRTRRTTNIAVAAAIVVCGILWSAAVVFNAGSEISAVPALTPSAQDPIGTSGWSRDGTDVIGTPGSLAGLDRRVSRVENDGFMGEHLTDWFRVSSHCTVMVAGYPRLAPNLLEVQLSHQSGTITAIPFTGTDPGNAWVEWRVALPPDVVALRIHAIDATTAWGGWLGFSTPFNARLAQTINHREIASTLATVGLTIVMVLGPGLVWRAARKGGFISVIWPGPLALCLGGAVCWGLGGSFAPEHIALTWVALTVAIVGWLGWRMRVWSLWSEVEKRVLLLFVWCVVGASAKAAFSGGPPGELYAGYISRTLEVGDRPDSRISFHTVQLIAHHLSPHGTEAAKYFAPWDFSGRGPLAGMAAAPLVLAVGAQPPLGMPEQAWRPFDRQGFAAYRIAMIALAAVAMLAMFGLLTKVATERQAWLGAALVALAPFFWHELYFSWPKLLSAACVLAAFTALLDRKALVASVWLGAGFLCHPLALMSVPFCGLWLLLSGPRSLRQRAIEAATLGAGVVSIIATWQQLNGWHPSQGGFLQYARAADGVYDVSALQWWSSRWTSLANTLVPFHVLLTSSTHPAFNALGTTSGPLMHYFFQYWTALPFAVGLAALLALAPAMFRALTRHRRVAALTLIGPILLFVLYWGIATTGLMREGGHVIFLGGWAFLVWSAADRIPAWTVALPFGAVRATEVFAMMFVPSLASGTWGGIWLLNDLAWLAVTAAGLAAVVWTSSRGSLDLATGESHASR